MMRNAWTGGQYSVYRAIFGACLAAYFASILPATLAAVAAAGAFLLAIGLFDRTAAVILLSVLAFTLGRNPDIADPGPVFVGFLLLAHLFVPPAPYGSWAARKRVDPRGGWAMPNGLVIAAWIVLAAGYAFSGYRGLVNGSWTAAPELLFAPLALVRGVRPWLWTAMLLMHVGLATVIDSADLSLGLIMLHLFTFDPAWVRGYAPERRDRVLYDGTCGLCHRTVRFIVAEDIGEAFTFAPLPPHLPQESVIVETEEGRRIDRSDAVRHMLARLGGMWRIAAIVLGAIPRPIRNAGYDIVARVRYRLFARPRDVCPMLPPDLRSRFTI